MMRSTIVHADDFAANTEISEHIMDCIRSGALYSVSVLPNSLYLDECLRLLKNTDRNIKLNIHFNLAEGRALSGRSALTDEGGMFSVSFFRILLWSLTPMRRKLKSLIKAEIKAQFEAYYLAVNAAGLKESAFPLRVDSHQHYHMIPIVLESIIEVVREEWGEIRFLRIPAEPLSPFLKNPKILFSCRPINLVKNLVLNTLAMLQKGRLSSYKDKSAVFFGIMMSGEMDKKRVSVLLKDFKRIAEKKDMDLEILAHPGSVSPEHTDKLMDPKNSLCAGFYTSENRGTEKQMLLELF